MKFKKIWNVVFYAALIGATIYIVKRKFIVPNIPSDQLIFEKYQDQGNIQVADYQDKTVVVNFWQTWCGPCIHEMPSLNEMNEIWNGLQVICVSDEPYDKVKSYIDKYPNIQFVSVGNIQKLGVSQYPTTYIYNSEGAKVFSKIGSKDWSDPNFIAMLKKNWSK